MPTYDPTVEMAVAVSLVCDKIIVDGEEAPGKLQIPMIFRNYMHVRTPRPGTTRVVVAKVAADQDNAEWTPNP